MICFENKGTLDVRAIKTMGINVKENAGAIGYFGTGLKYAIAVLLRERCEIEIRTGGEIITFESNPVNVRGKAFDIVCMNRRDEHGVTTHEELGFTTELGKNWEVWMAYRELYSNALDEGGKVTECAWYKRITLPGNTRIFVKGKKIEDVHNIRWKYFINERDDTPIASFNGVDVYTNVEKDKPGRFYYKGIFVGDSYVRSSYDYNFTEANIRLTEDRTPAYPFQIRWAIAGAFMTLQKDQKAGIALCKKYLVNEEHEFQTHITYADVPAHPLDTWLDIVGDLRLKTQDIGINWSAIQVHMKHREKSMLPKESVKLTPIQTEQLSRAVEFCKTTLGYDIDKYKLIVAHNTGDNTLGRADIEEQIMYLSTQAFGQGTKRVAAVLVEEFVHVEYKVEDETLEQKMVYLEKILSLGEDIRGVPL